MPTPNFRDTMFFALIIGTPIALIMYWLMGLLGGFHVSEKIPPRFRTWLRKVRVIPIPLAATTTIGIGIAYMHGCISLSAAMQEVVVSSSRILPANPIRHHNYKSTILITVTPELKRFILEMKQEEARQRKFEADLEADQQRIKRFSRPDPVGRGGATIAPDGTVNFKPMMLLPQGVRKGPFCRITCTVHHDAAYDVEVSDVNLCRTGKLDPTANEVPGWTPTGDGHTEYQNGWPGPGPYINDPAEQYKYKLYWTRKSALPGIVR